MYKVSIEHLEKIREFLEKSEKISVEFSKEVESFSCLYSLEQEASKLKKLIDNEYLNIKS